MGLFSSQAQKPNLIDSDKRKPVMSEIEYELIVNVLDEQNIQARFQDGSEKEGEVNFNPLRRETIGIFAEWLRESRVKKRKELEVLGTHLYETLFNGQLETFFEECLEKAKDARQSLVVRLSFGEKARNLSDLPWEYLFYKRTNQFLATYASVSLVLSRFVTLDKGRPTIVLGKSPLIVLIVVSNPEGTDPEGTELPPVAADQVIEDIQKLARDVDESSSIQIHILDKPTLEGLMERLNNIRPHVLHFIGHGRSSSKMDKEVEIALLEDERDEKSVLWVQDEFVDVFSHIDREAIPRLVLLHLCESSEIMNNPANFTYLAPRLLNVNVPAVVAMQHPITNQAAIAFCKAFYRKLAKGESVDAAVQEGRWRITTSIRNAYDNRVFGTPVLYMRSHGGIIQRTHEIASTQTKQFTGEIVRVPQQVSIMTSDNSLNPPSRLAPTQDLPIPSTASLLFKQDVVSFVEPRQAKSVSIEPKKTDSNQVSRFNVVNTVFLTGKNKVVELPKLSDERKVQITQMLSKIRDQLFMEANTDDMKAVLLGYLESEDSDFRVIIWSMIDALAVLPV
jgi:hypothetical protein